MAEQITIDRFDYLNNNESPVILDQYAAQDLLNVDITPNGKSVKKRAGFGTYKTLSGSQALHGGIHFFDSSSNDVQVWGSSTALWGIVADAAATQLVSSATLNATWDCADTQGFAYCVDSSRDALIKTNGATISWFTSPLGTIAAMTPERLLIAGVAAAPSTIYYSAASNFTNFTVGINPTDSSTEQIAAPGSRITNLDYACGRWLWWKDLSFGYVVGTDQTNLQIKIVSSNIGTQDNSDAVDPDGNVYFRGQDGHIYKYDCNSLTRLTTSITPSIQTSGRRTSAAWLQSTQSDFQAGVSSQPAQISLTISPGDVVTSSFTFTDNTSATFSLGSFSSAQVSGNTVIISTNSSNPPDNSFESTLWSGGGGSGWSMGSPLGACAGGAKDGTKIALYGSASGSYNVTVSLIDGNTAASYGSTTFAYAANCTWVQRTVSLSGASRKYVRLKMDANSGNVLQSPVFTANGADITFWTRSNTNGGSQQVEVDFFESGRSTLTTGAFTSRTFDTGTNFNLVGMTPTYTVDDGQPTFMLQTSADGSSWADLTSSSSTVNNAGKRYLRYISTFTFSGTQDSNTSLSSMVVFARSSGTYLSAVHNAANLTAWDVFQKNDVANSGTLTYYMRSSTNTFTILSTTPAWTAATSGAVPTISTGTYFQVRAELGITATSDNPTLNDFTVNWFEGTASDKAYAIYYDLGIWWSLAYGSGQATNNYIFKYDLNTNGWTLYNFGAGGFLIQNNSLYFGTTAATGKIYRFGGSTDDDGTAINAYWKSKDFAGRDPFLENSYSQIDTFIRRNANQTLTAAYTLNSSTTSTSYSISLSSTTNATIRNKKLLPSGKIGGLINVQFSDTSSAAAWELLGFRITFEPLPYRPTQ